MSEKWVRKDFSKNSRIKDTLLLELLRYQKVRNNEIPEEYEDQIAAAGISREEQKAIEELRAKKK